MVITSEGKRHTAWGTSDRGDLILRVDSNSVGRTGEAKKEKVGPRD
jgi:hypothetical protein